MNLNQLILILTFVSLFGFACLQNTTTIESETTVLAANTTESEANATAEIKSKVTIKIENNKIICSMACEENSGDVKKMIKWLKSNKSELEEEEVSCDAEKRFSTELKGWNSTINEEIKCEIDGKLSENYFVGIVFKFEFDPIKYIHANSIDKEIQLKEGTPVKASVVSNIPLNCEAGGACNVRFALNTDDSSYLRVLGDCKSQINGTMNEASWTLWPKLFVENTFKEATFNLSFSNNATNIDFKNIKLPDIKVTLSSLTKSYTYSGSCYNDPHCITHDGSSFEFHGYDGEYVVYENEENEFRVHMISEPCLKNYIYSTYCIKSLYIQSVDEQISFESKRILEIQYRDLSMENKNWLPLIWSGNMATIQRSLNGIKVTQDEYYYYIIGHFGTMVAIAKGGYSFQILPSKLEKGKVSGLLGDYNQIPGDDGVRTDLVKHIQKYNVTTNGKPKLSHDESYTVKSTKMYCKCTATESECSNAITNDILTPKSKNTKAVVPKLNVMDLTYTLNFNRSTFIQEESFQPANSSGCEKIEEDEVMKKCADLKVIDIVRLKKDCELDYESTNLSIWADYYIQARKGWCKVVLNQDSTFYDDLGNKRKDIIKTLCLNGCSGNGNCSDDGKCACKTGFLGDDCSKDQSKAPKLYGTLFENNLCDRSKKNNCKALALFVTDFAASENLKITYQDTTTNEKKIASAIPISGEIISALLDYSDSSAKGKLSARKFSVQVSFVDDKLSDAKSYIIYDSSCHQVKDETVSLKNGTCDIDATCYNENDKNPNGESSFCKPAISQYSWTSFGFRQSANLSLMVIFAALASFILNKLSN